MRTRVIQKLVSWAAVAVIGCVAFPALAEEKLPLLKVGDDTYTDVVVTKVTTTDIYFTHSSGMGNAKLKKLTPELQKHFQFNPAKATEVETRQAAANAQYRQALASARPAASRPADTAPRTGFPEDPVAPQITARSVRGQRLPSIAVQTWVTATPNVTGKFVLIDFWATWCGPCRQSIPHLNALYAKYQDKLVIIGLSDETVEDVRKMTNPKIDYFVGVDPQGRTGNELQVRAIPHVILVDPSGIVRFEGNPGYLNEKVMEHFLAKYE